MEVGSNKAPAFGRRGGALHSCLSLLLLGSSACVHAVQLSGTATAGLDYTSNAEQTTTNTQEDIIQRAGVSLSAVEERKRVRADANINLDYERYWNKTYDDEVSLTSGFGIFSVDLVEDFLNWQATFSRTDVLNDAADDDNPDTREYRNIFRTGPTISYAINRRLNLSVAGNYIAVKNSGADASDSQRAEGNARLNYQYNSLTSFNVGLRHDEVLDSDDDDEITNTNVSAGFTRLMTDGALSFSYGVQTVDSSSPSTESNETDSDFFDITFTRQNFLGQNWELSYLEETQDTSIGFSVDESGQADENDRVSVVSQTDIETRKQFKLGLSRDFSSFAYDLSLNYRESSFDRSGGTERYRDVVVGIQPKWYSRLIPRFEHRYTREDFTSALTGEDVTRLYRISASYQMVADVFFNGFVEFEKVDNDERATRESEEFSLGLGVRWDFL